MARNLAKHSRLVSLSVAMLADLRGIGSQATAFADPTADSSAEVLGLINQQRAQNGCDPVASNPQLAAATGHANDMLNSGVTGHSGSNGSSPAGRISDAGDAPVSKWSERSSTSVGAPEVRRRPASIGG